MKRGVALLTVLSLLLVCLNAWPGGARAQDISSWGGPTGSFAAAEWTGRFEEGMAAVKSPDKNVMVRLYQQPDTESEILFVYYDGVLMTLMETDANGWAHVQQGAMEGWMQLSDLVTEASSVPRARLPRLAINAGKENSVPMRDIPDDSGKKLSSYPSKVTATVIGFNENWAQIIINGKMGFMKRDYLWTNPEGLFVRGATTKPAVTFSAADMTEEETYYYPEQTYTESYTAPYYYGSTAVGEWTILDERYNAAVYNPNPSDHLNLRVDPDDRADSLGKYYNGTRVMVNYVLDDVNWAFVSIGTLTGYMNMNYLELGSERYYPRSVMPLVCVAAPGRGAYLREYRSQASQTLGLYSNGSTATLMGYNEHWAHVIIDGQIGFFAVDEIRFYDGSSLVPVAAPFSWNGPTGSHPIGAWTLGSTGWVINNPNPADRLNLRASPSTGAVSRGKYYNGVQVNVLDVTDGWAKVTIGSQSGYMDVGFLSNGYVSSAMPVLKTTSSVHLRASTSTKSASLGTLPAGTEVTLMGFTSQWAHVIVGGQTGFIYAQYLR